MPSVKSYAFTTLTTQILREVAVIRHEPSAPAVWDELARKELSASDRTTLGFFAGKLVDYRAHRVNEATIWARAIYPLLLLAERGSIRAWSAVPLAATFDDVEIHGEADGALAGSLAEEIGLPYLVVVDAKRGVSGTDPVAQLFGAMLCAARLNSDDDRPAEVIFGCCTIADVWTFVRGTVAWSKPKPTMSVLTSGEYMEKTEAAAILAILESIVAMYTS
jgi:hypothetical protein